MALFRNKPRFDFGNWSTGTFGFLSLKTTCPSCVWKWRFFIGRPTTAVKTNNTLSGKPLDWKYSQLPRNAKYFPLWSAQMIHSKPCRAMNKEGEAAGDREPFSELVETPIHPLLINIVPPFVNEINPMFHFHLNWEALRRLLIERSLWAAKHSVSASTIKYSASWLPNNGICWRAR